MEVLCLLKFYFSLLPGEIAIVLNARFPTSVVAFTAIMCASRLSNLSRGDCLQDAHAIWKVMSRTIGREIPSKYRLVVQSLQELIDTLKIRPSPYSASLTIQRQGQRKHRRGAKRKSVLQKTGATNKSRQLSTSNALHSIRNSTDEIKDEIIVRLSPYPTETAVRSQSHKEFRRGAKHQPVLHTHAVINPLSITPGSSTKTNLVKIEPGTEIPLSHRLAVKVQVSPPVSDIPYCSAPCPRLLFRTYCKKSAGINGLDGFVAGRFDPGTTKARLPVYAPEDETSPAFLNNAFHHLKRRTDGTPFGSTFISFSPSLVWVIFRAFTTSNHGPHISAVNGPQAAFTTSIYAVAPIIRALKDQEMWPGYKYSALYEFLVWGKVERYAIIRDFALSELQELAARRKAVRRFLRLQLFEKRRNMWALRNRLFENPPTLDANTGQALGELLVFFGLSSASSSEDVICTLLYSLLQGWAIHIEHNRDLRMQALHALQKAFKVDRAKEQRKVERAFHNAVDCACEEIGQERVERSLAEQRRLLKS